MTHPAKLPHASLWRRVAAAVYDYLLVLAIWFITIGIIVLFLDHFDLLMQNYHGVGRPPDWFLKGVILPIMLIEAWGFYAWFWVHGGQTLGMRSWRIKVMDYRGRKLAIWQTLVRFIGAWISFFLAGAGYWVIVLKPHQSLHDRLSATVTCRLSKTSKNSFANH